MCGIAFLSSCDTAPSALDRMVQIQNHRGPDDNGTYTGGGADGLGHVRLSILDLSDAGHQPMLSADGRYVISYNGEIYNYPELRAELNDYPFRSQCDTEVILAAYQQWGAACLDRMIGMFAFVIWDTKENVAWGARDRFGVKPFYYHETKTGGLMVASEIKALHAAGAAREPDAVTWATYFAFSLYDHSDATFWAGIRALPPGGQMTWSEPKGLAINTWYDVADAACCDLDTRSDADVADELRALLDETIALRFRADVPVGVCLSGGLDSSLLLGLIHKMQGKDSCVEAFSFCCGDPTYDESPWIEKMLEQTQHHWTLNTLAVGDVPDLASQVQFAQDEPFGGLPTLGMSTVHRSARERGVTVLLDGNGVDEGWAGYEYYTRAADVAGGRGPVQGARAGSGVLDAVMRPAFAALAQPWSPPKPSGDPLRDLQYRDIRFAKIPRALRFNDRVSMMHSRELREPFLDHRIVELGLRQPASRKIRDGQGKWLVRQLAREVIPESFSAAPKQAVQTPQREWLRGPLAEWGRERVQRGLAGVAGEWLDSDAAMACLDAFVDKGSDNSFPVWQLINLGLVMETRLESNT
jgi:asparagine synthase (glutamine-hydrolysing)